MHETNYLAHVGRSKRHGAPGPGSGRYPLGSGEEPYQDYPKEQLKKMAKSKDDSATKKELASKLNKGKKTSTAKKKSETSFTSSVRKRAEDFRKSQYDKKIKKEKEKAKQYKEQIRLEKTRLDKEKAKEEAKRLSKMSGKEAYKEERKASEEAKKQVNETKKNENNYSIKPKPVSEMSNQEIQNYLNRVRLEKDYNSIVNATHKSAGRKMVEQMLLTQGQRIGNQLLSELSKQFVDSVHKKMHEKDPKKKYSPSNKPIDEMNNNELKDFITRSSLEAQVNKYRDEQKKKKK